jgi:hypothetical protein
VYEVVNDDDGVLEEEMLEEDEEVDMNVFSSVIIWLVESGDGFCCWDANGIFLPTIGSPTTAKTRCQLPAIAQQHNSTTALSYGSPIKGPPASQHTSVVYRHELDKNVLNIIIIIRDQMMPPLLPPLHSADACLLVSWSRLVSERIVDIQTVDGWRRFRTVLIRRTPSLFITLDVLL